MTDLKAGSAEARFADMIWEREPVSSGELAKVAAEAFGWKKTTSFTVLKRLCERGIFQSLGGEVTSLISREEYYARHSQQYVAETFGGSLPAFLAAFTARKNLKPEEVEEIRRMIAEYPRWLSSPPLLILPLPSRINTAMEFSICTPVPRTDAR